MSIYNPYISKGKAMTQTKTNYISYLSVISAIAVVFLHANICFWNFEESRTWISANIIESIFYFAVPVFFMISGATLLDYNERYSTKTFFAKRARKTLIPYLVWSVIGLLFSIFFEKAIALSDLSAGYVAKALLEGTSVASLYWFFPALFCIYLAIPPLAAIPKEKKGKIFTYIAILCLILNIGIPFILTVSGSPYTFPLFMSIGSGYLFYTIIGYLFREITMRPVFRIVIYVLGIAGFITQTVGTQLLSFRTGGINETLKGYTNLPCILYAAAVFIFIKSIFEKTHKNGRDNLLDRLVGRMSKYTMAIYMMHWYFLRIFVEILHIDETLLAYRLLSPFFAIALSMGLTFLLRKIPVVRRIVPD